MVMGGFESLGCVWGGGGWVGWGGGGLCVWIVRWE